MIKIQSMEESHIPQVWEIEKRCFTIPWTLEAFYKEIQENHLAAYIVAIEEDQVVGYAGMWKVIDEGHITNVGVVPERQREGIGSLLIEGLIHLGEQHQLRALTLEVRKSNFSAQGLYGKYNFEPMGVRKNYYQDTNEDAIIMWRYL